MRQSLRQRLKDDERMLATVLDESLVTSAVLTGTFLFLIVLTAGFVLLS